MENNEEKKEDVYTECPKCERRVKEGEKTCPYCQYDLENRPKIEKEEKTLVEKWWFWAIVVSSFIIIACVSDNINKNTSIGTNNKANTTNSVSKNTNNTNNTDTKVKKVKVTVADFSTMTKEEIQEWCSTNKITCNITENYSDTIEQGLFVSQSSNANSTIYQGDKITVIYSLGKEPTIGQKNALKTGKDYLRVMPFSYTSLIKQLEYEGYSKEEATYGADNCGADWNEQATKMAKEYIDKMSFSRSGLISQLKYEGFTNEQAEYGVSSIGY